MPVALPPPGLYAAVLDGTERTTVEIVEEGARLGGRRRVGPARLALGTLGTA
jgi:hypothetical protein